MLFDAIIFDLDGVICSTDTYHYKAWKTIAEEQGIPFNETVNNRLRGVSRMESLNIILEQYTGPALTQKEKEQLAQSKNALYRELLEGMSPQNLAPAVKETLQKLRAAGIKLAIGSSSRNTPVILEKLGLAGFFDAVADGNGITHSKPHPEVFLLAAQKLELPPARCLVVEDAAAGITAAKAGGFATAGIGEAAHCSPSYVLQSIPNLLRIFNI